MLLQFCDDACDSVLIENNGIASESGCNPFSSDSIVFNENRITRSSQSCSSVDTDAGCKWALR